MHRGNTSINAVTVLFYDAFHLLNITNIFEDLDRMYFSEICRINHARLWITVTRRAVTIKFLMFFACQRDGLLFFNLLKIDR